MSVPPDSSVPPSGEPASLLPVKAGDEKQWVLFAHLSALLGLVVPLGNILGPLVIWLIKKDSLPLVNEQGKEALNFNLTVLVAAVISWLLVFVLIGFVLFPAVVIFWLVCVIVAAVQTSNTGRYRYPLTIRFIA